MELPFDLDALAAQYAASTQGEWQIHLSHLYGPDPDRVLIAQTLDWPANSLSSIAALHNAWPAIAAELRAARARIKEMAEEIDVWKEMFEREGLELVADRDARMRREGAIEALESMADSFRKSDMPGSFTMRDEVARLRGER